MSFPPLRIQSDDNDSARQRDHLRFHELSDITEGIFEARSSMQNLDIRISMYQTIVKREILLTFEAMTIS
jgi:hypothetical protein